MMGSFQLSYLQLLFIAVLLECKVAPQRPCKQLHQLSINYVQRDSVSISCLTTTHPLESLTVKLRRFNPVKDILIYPNISPASEHQRWSVRNEAGNVTLELKDIRVSDSGLYDCQVYSDLDCLNETQFNLTVKECKRLDSVQATQGSSVLLPCSEPPQQNRTDQVTWKVITGHHLTDIIQYRPQSKPLNSTEKLPRPLYERVRQLKDGSLLIRDAVDADELWYQCRVNENTCYEVRLMMKVFTDPPAPTDSTFVQTEGNINTRATMQTDLTVAVMTTIASLFVLMLLIICLIHLKKLRRKINNQTELHSHNSIYYSEISRGFNVPLYSVVQHSRNHDHLRCEQTEAPACEPNHIYDNRML